MRQDLRKKLLEYIEGEHVDFSSEDLSELRQKSIAEKRTVYRGLYFETKEEFLDKHPDYNQETKTFTYKSKRQKSFSEDLEVAEVFAQDMYSNYGIVIELEIDSYIDINSLVNPKDFNHEKEFLVLDPLNTKVRIIKEFHGSKNAIGLKE